MLYFTKCVCIVFFFFFLATCTKLHWIFHQFSHLPHASHKEHYLYGIQSCCLKSVPNQSLMIVHFCVHKAAAYVQ